MTYAWTQDLPITLEMYHEIIADLGDQPAEGLIAHVAQVLPNGDLRYLDVWESEAACERFTEERLHPVVGRALARHQFRLDGGEPPRQPVQIAHVWAPAAVNRLADHAPVTATHSCVLN
jgi:hypothetical protein